MIDLLQRGDWTAVTGWLLERGGHILLILVLVSIVLLVMRRVVPAAVERTIKKEGCIEEEINKRRETLNHVLLWTGQTVIIVIAAFMILSELGLDITPVLAGVGVAGIAIGFGAQNLVRDILSGLFILFENQYGKGDVVGVAGIYGLVEEVNLRRTVLRDLDGTVHSIPNGVITTSSNLTRDWSRVNMNITVAYGENIDRVIEVINRVGKEMAEDPQWKGDIVGTPRVLRVDAFEDSGIAIKILGETKPIRQWDVMGELRRRLKNTFDEEGIEIPFPYRTLVFKDVPTRVEVSPSLKETKTGSSSST